MRTLKFLLPGFFALLCFDALANDGAWRRATLNSAQALVDRVVGANWHGLNRN